MSSDQDFFVISGKVGDQRIDSRLLEERIQAAVAQGHTRLLIEAYGQHGIGGRLWKPRTELPPRVQRMIMLGTYVDKAGLDWMGPPDQITMAYNWEGVLGLLREKYGDRARVTVVPDATIQYFPALQGAS